MSKGGEGPAAGPMTRAELEAYLVRPEVRARALRVIRRRVGDGPAEELAQDAMVDALRASRRPAAANVKSWFDVICRRIAASHLDMRRRRKPFEGPAPVAAARLDEAGLPIDDDDPLQDVDPSCDPERERSFRADAWLLPRWAQEHLTDPEEQETFRWMCEWAGGDRTYADIAADNRIPLAALNKRVERLKERVAPAFERYRRGVVMLALLGGAVAVGIVALALYLLLRAPRQETIGPVPAREMVRPAPSADAAPQDTPFEPAQPTPAPPAPGPAVPAKPRR